MRSPHRTLAATLALALVATLLAPGVRAQPDLAREAAQPTLGAILEIVLDDLAADALWDVAELRSLVASQIALDGYDGILKGARGALLSGSANAADQALVLAALLERALIPYRFARCDLAADTTSRPGGAPDPDIEATAPETGDILVERAESLAAEIDDPELRAALQEVVELWQAQHAKTAEASVTLAAELAGIPLGVDVSTATEASPTIGHVWVQAALGAEWRDLDTTTADGTAACEPTDVVETIPGEWVHRATVAIEVEQRRGGQLETTDAFVYRVPAQDLASARIAVTFGEPAGLVDDGSGMESSFSRRTPAGLYRYTPVILVDGLLGAGKPIELPPPSAIAGLGDVVGDVIEDLTSELFGDDAVGSDEGHHEPHPYTGAWIRIELTAPDGRTLTLRSEIFDRIGIVARSDGTAEEAEVQPLTEVDGEWAETSALWQVGILLDEMTVPALDEPLDIGTVSGVSGYLDGLLRMYPTVHRGLGGRPDGPIVLLAELRQVASGEGTATRLILDALHVPAAPTADRLEAARDAQALLGAEELLLAFLESDSSSASDSVSVLRGEPSLSLRTIGPDEIGSLPEGLSSQAQARISERLGAGYWLLVPDVPPVGGTAWWTVDTRSGLVRDEHETGRHTVAEDIVVRSQAVSRAERFRRFACKWAFPIAIAASLVLSISGNPEGPKLQRAIYNVTQQIDRREQQRKAAQAACAGIGVGPKP
jgi:hypothetical protein